MKSKKIAQKVSCIPNTDKNQSETESSTDVG